MNIGNFIAMLAGGILLVMIVMLMDKVVSWPWLAQHLLYDRNQTLTITFLIGAFLSAIISIRNNR